MQTKAFAVMSLNPKELGRNGLAFSFAAVTRLFDRIDLAVRAACVSFFLERDYDYAKWLVAAHWDGYAFADPPDEKSAIVDESEAEVYPLRSSEFSEQPVFTPQADDTDEEELAIRDQALERAMDELVDFCFAIFEENGWMKEDGELAKETRAPWAMRSKLSIPVKERMKMVIENTEPKVFSLNSSKLWQYNCVAYPEPEQAKAALVSAYNILIGKAK